MRMYVRLVTSTVLHVQHIAALSLGILNHLAHPKAWNGYSWTSRIKVRKRACSLLNTKLK